MDEILADGEWHPIMQVFANIREYIDPRVALRRRANSLKQTNKAAHRTRGEPIKSDTEIWAIVHEDYERSLDIGQWQVMQCLLRDGKMERRGPYGRSALTQVRIRPDKMVIKIRDNYSTFLSKPHSAPRLTLV